MSLETDLIQFFGNLPYLPKAEIAKHLECFEKFKCAIYSKNWKYFVDLSASKTEKSKISVKLKTEPDSTYFEFKLFGDVEFGDIVFKALSISFEKSLSDKEEMSCGTRNEHDHFIHYSMDPCQSIRNILAFCRSMFTVEFRKIDVNFDHGLITVEFLKSLSIDSVIFLDLEGDNFENQELEDFLKTVKLRGSVKLKLENFQGGPYLFINGLLQFSDARWITREFLLESVNCSEIIFEKCQFSSSDLNEFLHLWRKDQKIHLCECSFSFEKEVNLEEILEGFEVEPWDPSCRSRNFLVESVSPMELIDFSDGHDIRSDDETLATISLSEDKKKVDFYVWHDRFPFTSNQGFYKKAWKLNISVAEKELEEHKNDKRAVRILTKWIDRNVRNLAILEEGIRRDKQEI